ncbi:MAG TPA: YdeI/OmpD-associated family protein [Bauldia sp.]|nr:YdeI/OmpD-associated family protein [Bauldia sp.]
MSEPRFFPSAAAWRAWLEENHAREDALLVGFHKVETGRGGLTYREAVDGALIYGWIDAVRRGGAEHWTIRFTKRRPRSIWSAINIKRVEELKAAGEMKPAGLAAFEERDPARQKKYSYENRDVAFSAEYEKKFRANRKAWDWFQARPPSYRRPATWWVMSAVKPETRDRRLATLIADSAAGRKIKLLTPPKAPKKEKGNG